ncbi:ATP-grasp domain-containing protein [Methanolobus mangrovi]|uniref:ATP-grasp domain-containing protein n=1 Tax=Methanolobus mangrovi TaxID=3072977 RepID=A0AA51UGD8_9EURY|nr:ATP-grasp domain-containing protein [Methanolobus mangrovi]WMW22645.1 ATP-grasp domain-containing protein [Methanolobus mangrovi]
MKNILVIGFSTRNIVCSGKRAGYNMYSIDAFCDYDLLQCSAGAKKLDIGETFDVDNICLEELAGIIESFNVAFDAIIPGSGFETIGLERLPYRVLGNEPELMKEVSDKYRFSTLLKRLNIAHPKTVLLSEIDKLQLPAMVKPACSGGGIFNTKVENEDDLKALHEKSRNTNIPACKSIMIAQEYIDGTPASVSVISTKEKAIAIAVNEQLIGIPWLTKTPFAYCGNITPYVTPYASEMKKISEELILELGLVGSNGVDFIISENGPVVIEVNARFQGSLDSVEMATGINLLDAHMKAFEGNINIAEISEIQYAGRAIVYAGREMMVNEAVQKKLLEMNVCDIPNVGQVINPEEPVISVLCSGKGREGILAGIEESVIFIGESLNLLDSR